MAKTDYIYKCNNGIIYGISSKQHCLICKHCTDIFWDYTNGPYMTFCKFNEDNDENEWGETCKKFELEDGTLTIEEYERGNNNDNATTH